MRASDIGTVVEEKEVRPGVLSSSMEVWPVAISNSKEAQLSVSSKSSSDDGSVVSEIKEVENESRILLNVCEIALNSFNGCCVESCKCDVGKRRRKRTRRNTKTGRLKRRRR